MAEKKHFPTIITEENRSGNTLDSSFALVVKSIIHGNLFLDQDGPRDNIHTPYHYLNPERLQLRRASLISALCCWPENTTIELILDATPDMLYRTYGCISIAYVVHVTAESADASKELALSRYLALVPLLSSHFTEAEFEPVCDPNEYSSLVHPFYAGYALSIQRINEVISLGSPLSRHQVGFIENDNVQDDPGSQSIHYIYPWITSLDDWSLMIETIMLSMEPVQVRIRLRPIHDRGLEREKEARIISDLETLLSIGTPDHVAHYQQLSLLRDISLARLAEISGPCCQLGVYVTAVHPVDISLGSLLGQSITGCPSKDDFYRGGFYCVEVPAALSMIFITFMIMKYSRQQKLPVPSDCPLRH